MVKCYGPVESPHPIHSVTFHFNDGMLPAHSGVQKLLKIGLPSTTSSSHVAVSVAKRIMWVLQSQSSYVHVVISLVFHVVSYRNVELATSPGISAFLGFRSKAAGCRALDCILWTCHSLVRK